MAYYSARPQQSLPWGGYRPRMQYLTGLEYDQLRPDEDAIGSGLNIWDIYNERASLVDSDLVLDFNSSMDVLLVFAGLFSAVLTGFIIETYKVLRPDQADLTNQLLYAILQNQSPSSIELSPDFSPPAYAVRVNALFFASLLTSLLTALAAMLVKQWVGYYDRGLRKITSKQIRARTRQYRYDGVVRWHMSNVVTFVPMVLHLSLFLFFAGIVDFLFAVNKPIAFMSLAFVAAGLVLYLFATGLPLFSSGAPFRSPITQFLDDMAQKARRYTSTRRSRSNPEEKAGDEAIEDPADLWFGEDEPQARTVRLTRTLDVGAIVWLMIEADKTTERMLIDTCFEKLMSLQHIAIKNPSSFFRREILRTYRQMATTCLDVRSGPRATFTPVRWSRARLFCRFLDWYLKLPRSAAQTHWLRDNLPFSETAMPRGYAQYAHDNDDHEALVTAHLAYRRLFHLHLASNAACEVCLKEPIFYGQFEAQVPSERQQWMRDNGAFVVQDLISITECVLNHPVHDTSRVNQVLDHALLFIKADINAGRTFRPLKYVLRNAKPRYPMAAAQWCDVLNAAIGNVPAESREREAGVAADAPPINAAPRMRRPRFYGSPSVDLAPGAMPFPLRGDGENALSDQPVFYPNFREQNERFPGNDFTSLDPPIVPSGVGYIPLAPYITGFPQPPFPPTGFVPHYGTPLPTYFNPGQNVTMARQASQFRPIIVETDQDPVLHINP